MTTIGAFEAKTHLSSLLDRAESGEIITITKHGRPVACLVPIGRQDNEKVREAIDTLKRIQKGKRSTNSEILEWIREGQK